MAMLDWKERPMVMGLHARVGDVEVSIHRPDSNDPWDGWDVPGYWHVSMRIYDKDEVIALKPWQALLRARTESDAKAEARRAFESWLVRVAAALPQAMDVVLGPRI